MTGRTSLRLEATARAALKNSDIDGVDAAAYSACWMASEALLGRQGLRAIEGDGSDTSVEDAVSAQFASEIPAFAKRTFERLQRTGHTAQNFDPPTASIIEPDAAWAIETAAAASGVEPVLAVTALERFV